MQKAQQNAYQKICTHKINESVQKGSDFIQSWRFFGCCIFDPGSHFFTYALYQVLRIIDYFHGHEYLYIYHVLNAKGAHIFRERKMTKVFAKNPYSSIVRYLWQTGTVFSFYLVNCRYFILKLKLCISFFVFLTNILYKYVFFFSTFIKNVFLQFFYFVFIQTKIKWFKKYLFFILKLQLINRRKIWKQAFWKWL